MSKLQEVMGKLTNSKNKVLEVIDDKGVVRSTEWAEVLNLSKKIAALLPAGHQKVINVVLPNGINYLATMLAVIARGHIFNPLPYFLSTVEMPKIWAFAEPELIITDRSDILQLSNDIKKVSPNNWENESGNISTHSINEDLSGDHVACLYYSSGTTGNPKGILYSHDNIYYLITSICDEFCFSESTNQWALLPFGHTASINYNIWPAIFSKSPLYVSPSYEAVRKDFFKIIDEFKINYTQIVPTIAFMLLKMRYSVEGLDLSSLPFIGCGSSVLPEKSQIEFQKKYGLPLANLYGLSESGPSHIDNPNQPNWKPGSIGKALNVNQCRLTDEGEIILKGKNIFVGYHKNRKLYDSVVRDGWFHTGDIAEEINGQYTYKDRSKDLIIKSGINIFPAEIEEVLYKHPLIHECAVVGEVNNLLGEKIHAFITPKTQIENTRDFINEIRSHCKQYLTSFKVPDKIDLIEEIPKTPSGKLLRRGLRNQEPTL